jgi:PAS domain S-box-containing protein
MLTAQKLFRALDARLQKANHLRGTVLFLVFLALVLFVGGYKAAHMMRMSNRRTAHELSAKLVAEQIRVILNDRINMARRLARNPTIIHMYVEGSPHTLDSRTLLNTVNEMAATSLIYTLSALGRTFASADSQEALLVGKNYSFRPYFARAMQGDIAIYPAVGAYTSRRGVHVAVPIYGDSRSEGHREAPLGVLVMKIGMEEIDRILLGQPDKLAMVSPDGVILSTNQEGWLTRSLRPLSAAVRSKLRKSRQFGDEEIRPLKYDLSGDRVRIGGTSYSIVHVPLPIDGWSIVSCHSLSAPTPLSFSQTALLMGGVSVTGGMAFLIFFLGVNILHRRITERKLRRAEEKYRSIFENAVMGVYQSTVAGRFFEASPSMASILGYDSPADLIDSVKDMRDIYYDAHDRDAWLDLLAKHQQFTGFETRYLKKNGEPIWVSLSSRLAWDEDLDQKFIEGFCIDVSEKKEAIEALRRERDILMRIMSTSPAGIVLSDARGIVTYANALAEKLLGIHPLPGGIGYTQPDFSMYTLDGDPIPPDETPASRARREMAMVRKDRCVLQWPDGTQVIVSVSIAPTFGPGGDMAELVTLYEDITHIVRAEQEAAEQQQQLFEVDRMVAMGILTSGIAHEINNPNTYILSSAQTLADAWEQAGVVLAQYYRENGDFVIGGIPYSEMREILPKLNARILDGSRRIGRIIKELLVFSRREGGGATEPVDLNRVINTSEILLSSMIKKSTNRFDMRLSPGELVIEGNFQRLEQVLINVIQNACQALPDPDRGITVTSCASDGQAVVTVADEGEGISSDNIGRVMDPFFTTKREKGGTGLGLAVSSTIVHDLGGSISFDSREGRGTTVTLCFPLRGEAQPARRPHAE